MFAYVACLLIVFIYYSEGNMQSTDAEQENILVYVNGFKLEPLMSNTIDSESFKHKYFYKYANDDILNVSCKRVHGLRGRLRIFCGQNLNAAMVQKEPEMCFMKGKGFNEFIVQCFIDNSDIRKNTAEILFLANRTFDGKQNELLVILAYSVGAVVFSVASVWSIYWYIKRKTMRLPQEAYENFSNQNDSPNQEYPNQWDYINAEYQYTETNVRPLEQRYPPQNRQSSKPSEHEYAEIDYAWATVQGVKSNLGEDNTNRHGTSNNTFINQDNNRCIASGNIEGSYNILRRSNSIVDNPKLIV